MEYKLEQRIEVIEKALCTVRTIITNSCSMTCHCNFFIQREVPRIECKVGIKAGCEGDCKPNAAPEVADVGFEVRHLSVSLSCLSSMILNQVQVGCGLPV